MGKSNMSFAVDENAVSWGLASVHTRALLSAKNNLSKIKKYKAKGLIGVAPSITSFMNKHRKYTKTGRLVHKDGSNFFGGIIPLAPISQTPEFKSKAEAILRYEYDFTDEEIKDAEEFISDLVNLGKKEDIQSIVEDTRSYKSSIESLWYKNEKQVLNYIRSILGYDPNISGKVCTYIMYPNFDINRISQIAKDRTFFYFGKRSETDPNKILSYMAYHAVHQSMLPHLPTMTRKQKDEFDAFLMFLTEKDVYNQLTGKSYFETGTKGEKAEVMARIYPFWLGYRYRNSDREGVDATNRIASAINRDKAYLESLPENSPRKKLYNLYNFEKLDPAKISRLFHERRYVTPYQFAQVDFSDVGRIYYDKYIDVVR